MKSQSAHTHAEHPLYGYQLYPNQKYCEVNNLSPIGAAQHIRNGIFLRSVYIDNWKMFKLTKSFNQQILMRSTEWSRCVQSGLAFMYGFIPQFDLTDLQIERAASNNMCIDGTTVPMCNCMAVEKYKDTMSINFDQTSRAFLGQHHVHELRQEIADILEVDTSQIPKMAHVFDISMVHQCHEAYDFIHKDRCMPPEVILKLNQVLSENGKHNIEENPAFQRYTHIKMHPLLSEMSARMSSVVNDPSDTMRFILQSAHDTTLEPFAAMLGISPGRWPRYASRVVVEFYTSAEHPRGMDHSFVRFLFDGEDVTAKVSFCASSVITEDSYSLCPYSALKQFVDVDNMRDLGAEGYESACATNL